MGCAKTSLAACLIVALSLVSMPAWAAAEDAPSAGAMTADLLIARPLGVVFTAVGAAVFIISLPFTAAGGNIEQAGKELVVGPAKMTFVRCLGCRASGRYFDPGKVGE